MTERRRNRMAALAAALMLAAAPLAAQAGAEGAAVAPGTALVFDRSQMAAVPAGGALLYAHRRAVPEGAAATPIGDGEVRLARQAAAGGNLVDVSLTEDGRTRRLEPFPAASGNPVLPVFLESALRAIARATGGSPFYLRNRIREALWQGAEPEPVTLDWQGTPVAAARIVYRPFAGDRHAAQLGGFRDMELEFVLSEAVPGRFVSLAAATGPEGGGGFREEIRLIGEAR